jgi:hypothetical protein
MIAAQFSPYDLASGELVKAPAIGLRLDYDEPPPVRLAADRPARHGRIAAAIGHLYPDRGSSEQADEEWSAGVADGVGGEFGHDQLSLGSELRRRVAEATPDQCSGAGRTRR